MASTYKTTNLKLPQWELSDKPQMADFNDAFEKIDKGTEKISPNTLWGVRKDKYYSSESCQICKRIYLSPTGNDNNEGTQASPMKTINAAINRFAGIVPLRLSLADGTYGNNSQSNFYSIPYLRIGSSSSDAARVVINQTFVFSGCCQVQFEDLTFNNVDNSNRIIEAWSSTLRMNNCILNGGGSGDNHGIKVLTGNAHIYGSQVNNCSRAIWGEGGSHLSCVEISGKGNSQGYRANYSSIFITDDSMEAANKYVAIGTSVIKTSAEAPK